MPVFTENVEIQDGDIDIKDASGNRTILVNGEKADITLGRGPISGEQLGKDGDITMISRDGVDTIRLDGNQGNLSLGGSNHDGDITIKASSGNKTIRLNGDGGGISFYDASGNRTIRVSGEGANLFLGRGPETESGEQRGTDGDIILMSSDGEETIHLNGNQGSLSLGAGSHDGDIVIRNSARIRTVLLNGAKSEIITNDSFGKQTIRVNGEQANITLGRGPENTAKGKDGDITLISSDGEQTIRLNGEEGNLTLGGDKHDGDIDIRNSSAKTTIHLNGNRGDLSMGGSESGTDGDIFLFPSDRSRSRDSNATIHLNANRGDIILRNADCAEEFDVSEDQVEPGTVMVLDDQGILQPCTDAYDKKVAGVVSGAGDYKPAIVLDRKYSVNNRVPVALIGKVYCKVDACFSSIKVGDILTTSSTPGHAMKARDPQRSFGAVIGKALRSWKEGVGEIPILITLQ